MKKVLFVIANYPDQRQQMFEQHYSPRNAAYAERHGFEYRVEKGGVLFRNNPTWWKFTLVRDMVRRGELVDGDIVTHLDADMVIVDGSAPYVTTKSFSYAIDNGNTHCMGNYSLRITPWSRRLLDLILDEGLYGRHLHNSHWKDFREQAAWYTLAGILPHSFRPFFDYPNYGWHSHRTADTVFSIAELHEHVEVRSPAWNATLIADELEGPGGEALKPYVINPIDRERVIIRHFAGGQPWRSSPYTDRPLFPHVTP